MKRLTSWSTAVPCVITAAAFGGGMFAADRSLVSVVHLAPSSERQIAAAIVRQLPSGEQKKLDEQVRLHGMDLAALLRGEDGTAARAVDEKIFRVIEKELKPIPVRDEGFQEVFPDRRLDAAALPAGAEAARTLERARSVGRIERDDGGMRHIGTAFVVGDGLLATNCHVLRAMLDPAVDRGRPDGDLRLAGRFLVDFGDPAKHDPEGEYEIEGVAGYSRTRFMDVAVLRVAAKSRSGSRGLPPRIPLRRQPMTSITRQQPLAIGVLGYPDLLNLDDTDQDTQDTFRRIRERAGARAKVFSPGMVVGLDENGTIVFLDHVASTHRGQSGSPVLDRQTGEAVGIHFCCTEPGRPESVDPLACSSERLSDRRNNEAVSAWSVVSDALLGRILGEPRQAVLLARPGEHARIATGRSVSP